MLRRSQLAALSLEFGRDKSGHSPFKKKYLRQFFTILLLLPLNKEYDLEIALFLLSPLYDSLLDNVFYHLFCISITLGRRLDHRVFRFALIY